MDLKIKGHPILDFKPGTPVTITFDGQSIPATDDITIATALHAAGIMAISKSGELSRPRGIFCAIGNCSSCMMVVNGEPNVRTCVVFCEDGMEVKTQEGKGAIV